MRCSIVLPLYSIHLALFVSIKNSSLNFCNGNIDLCSLLLHILCTIDTFHESQFGKRYILVRIDFSHSCMKVPSSLIQNP